MSLSMANLVPRASLNACSLCFGVSSVGIPKDYPGEDMALRNVSCLDLLWIWERTASHSFIPVLSVLWGKQGHPLLPLTMDEREQRAGSLMQLDRMLADTAGTVLQTCRKACQSVLGSSPQPSVSCRATFKCNQKGCPGLCCSREHLAVSVMLLVWV